MASALVLAALHLWLRVEPDLRYHRGVPAFFVDAPFFAQFARLPGGWLEYVAAAGGPAATDPRAVPRRPAARVFLNCLRLAPFHQAEAGRALEALATDPRGTKDAELSLIRTWWPKTDEAVTRLPTEILLRQLLTANRTNQMAYAYLLSHHLLGGDLDRLEEDLASLSALGHTALPRPCEEALALRRPPGGDAQPQVSGFPVHPAVAARSDLYLMDLRTRQSRRLESNSDQADSWHCWSGNGRWVVFSSKRGNGVFARPHFTYVDEAGTFHKPWVLPQADPALYDACIQTFNLPEFVRGPIAVSPARLARAVVRPQTVATPRRSYRADAQRGAEFGDAPRVGERDRDRTRPAYGTLGAPTARG